MLSNFDINQIPEDVQDELTDPKFGTRKHYSRVTYSLGCRGPLCKKAERDRARRRTERKATIDGRQYKPNPLIRIDADEERLLTEVLNWYIGERPYRKNLSQVGTTEVA